MIKAIETHYKGYRFRSRLEARWAVFFDHLGFDWEYEYEGFHIDGGSPYLPDFLLKDDGKFPDIWVEVKPQKPMKPKESKRYYQVGKSLSDSAEHAGFLVTMGDPLEANAFLFGSFGGVKKLGPLVESDFISFFMVKSQKEYELVFNAAKAARSARFERKRQQISTCFPFNFHPTLIPSSPTRGIKYGHAAANRLLATTT